MMNEGFSAKLLDWYKDKSRDLPWRHTDDPYKIWLSEIILQQTRVAQGMEYYFKFIELYPTVGDLASASEDEVMRTWQGLGYYSRARNLHHTAKVIHSEFNDVFPSDYKGISQLKGIGSYTAAAIASFAFGLPHAVVDGNVYRVLSRIFGIYDPIDSTVGKKKFQQLADELINKTQPGKHNQAIMEFGALQCVPKSPDCGPCPFLEQCFAYQEQKIAELPVKQKKLKSRDRYFNYFVLRTAGSMVIKKREGKDIWQNLFDFPLIETNAPIPPDELLVSKEFQQLLGKVKFNIKSIRQSKPHILSHQRIHARFFEIELGSPLKASQPFITIAESELNRYAIPKLIENYLQDNQLSLLDWLST